MYPLEPTQTELLNEFLESQRMSREDIIKEYINKHDTSGMMEGVHYYFKENEITKRKIYRYDEAGNRRVDDEATNNKLASGWHKLLVDQKTSYLVGDPISMSSATKDEKALEHINKILGDDFDDTLPELVKNASNKGVEWLHVYVDESGAFDHMIIPAQEFIPIYDNTKRKNLVGGIRHYELDDGTVKIELWDGNYVTFYEKEQSSGAIVLDMSYEVNPQSHWYYDDNGYGWSTEEKIAIPFIPFSNNEEQVSDVTFYKDYIDAYDFLMSDTTNTLEDIQDIFYILKGYDDTNLAEFSVNMKRYKAVKTSEEGGVDTAQAEVPMDSVNSHLDRLIENIYQFGQGVNTNTDKFGNSPSGIALKFLFSLLDMKANVMERKFTKALEELMWFVCEYLSIAENEEVDYKDIKFTFNKSMLMNEQEQSQIAQQSKGVISNKTVVANHPWVDDPDAEEKQMEKERKELEQAYPDIEGEANEEPE